MNSSEQFGNTVLQQDNSRHANLGIFPTSSVGAGLALAVLVLSVFCHNMHAQTQAICDGGFQSRSECWYGSASIQADSSAPSGYDALLAGSVVNQYGNGGDTLYQFIVIPPTATKAILTYSYKIVGNAGGRFPLNTLTASLYGTNSAQCGTKFVGQYSNLQSGNYWHKASFDVSAFVGQAVEVYFMSSEDMNAPSWTDFFVDNVSLTYQ